MEIPAEARMMKTQYEEPETTVDWNKISVLVWFGPMMDTFSSFGRRPGQNVR